MGRFLAALEIDRHAVPAAFALNRQSAHAMIKDHAARLTLGIVFGQMRFQLRQSERSRFNGNRLLNRIERQDKSCKNQDSQWNCQDKRNPAVHPQQESLL
jgi:hypothetical protein